MASPNNQDALAKEIELEPPKSTRKPTVGNSGQDKDQRVSGGTLPGWTMIMHPLKKKRGTTGATTTAAADNGARTGSANGDSTNGDLKITDTNGSGLTALREIETLDDLRSDDELLENNGEGPQNGGPRAFFHRNGTNPTNRSAGTVGTGEYKTYRRRWFGLVQLVLLNIVVSWDWLTFSANSTTCAKYYGVTLNAINWLSTAFLFAFVFISPATMWVLHKGGPKLSIMIASSLLLVGNWVRYGATRSGAHYGATMFGQILIGFAQPFVLAAPTRYSDLWFTSRGRIAATAIMSLANPFGGALAQLINPMWADEGQTDKVPNMVLYVSIIASIASIPSFFIPHSPPTPVAPSSEEEKHPLIPSLMYLIRSLEFWLVVIPFMFYIGLFNSISTLVNGMLAPYSFSETQAGIGGALLIVVGLISSAVTAPVIDRNKAQLLMIKICVPLIAFSYLAFTFAPATRSLAAIYVILSFLGASSFSLMPVALEYLIEITHPVSPEVTSTICWTGGQLTGGIFILVSDALRAPGKDDGSTDDKSSRPPGNMYKALIFQTVMAMVVLPLPMMLGLFGRHKHVRMRRVEADNEATARRNAESGGAAASA